MRLDICKSNTDLERLLFIVNDLAKCGRKRPLPLLFSISSPRVQRQRKYYGEVFPLLRVSSVAFTRFSAYFLQTSRPPPFLSLLARWENGSDKHALPGVLFAQLILVNNQNYTSEKERGSSFSALKFPRKVYMRDTHLVLNATVWFFYWGFKIVYYFSQERKSNKYRQIYNGNLNAILLFQRLFLKY